MLVVRVLEKNNKRCAFAVMKKQQPQSSSSNSSRISKRCCCVCGGTSGVKSCSCGSVHYCALPAPCQRSDWDRHKAACKELRKAHQASDELAAAVSAAVVVSEHVGLVMTANAKGIIGQLSDIEAAATAAAVAEAGASNGIHVNPLAVALLKDVNEGTLGPGCAERYMGLLDDIHGGFYR